jgi:hypothetical protein
MKIFECSSTYSVAFDHVGSSLSADIVFSLVPDLTSNLSFCVLIAEATLKTFSSVNQMKWTVEDTSEEAALQGRAW